MRKYSYNKIDETCAKATGVALPISTKTSVEICKFIRGKPVDKVKALLELQSRY